MKMVLSSLFWMISVLTPSGLSYLRGDTCILITIKVITGFVGRVNAKDPEVLNSGVLDLAQLSIDIAEGVETKNNLTI